MLSFDEMQEYLTRIADDTPPAIYRELNGGIILLPEAKLHPKNLRNDLFTLGEYHYDPRGFGRYITIYYGSFQRVCGGLTDDQLKKRLREVLHHELTHHLEHLAGDQSLEIQDAVDIQNYRRSRGEMD